MKKITNLNSILKKKSKLSEQDSDFILRSYESGEINKNLHSQVTRLNLLYKTNDINHIIKGLEKVSKLINQIYNKKSYLNYEKTQPEQILNNYMNELLSETVRVSTILNSNYKHVEIEK